MNDPTYTVDNHDREEVAFEYWSGTAGVRRSGRAIEFAYIGDSPRRAPIGQRGTIGGDAVELLTLQRSKAVQVMMVGTARLVD